MCLKSHCRFDDLAYKAVDIGWWYDEALVVFESNTFDQKKGLSAEFSENANHAVSVLEEVRRQYKNVYMRSVKNPEDIREGIIRKVGFQTNRKTKQIMVDQFTKWFEDGLFHDPDEAFYKEISIYEERTDGSYGNIPGDGNHDDIVMTDMIANLVHQTLSRSLPTDQRHARRPASNRTVNESSF